MNTRDGYIHPKYKYQGNLVSVQYRYGKPSEVVVPVWRIDWQWKESKYTPHQGKQECERRCTLK